MCALPGDNNTYVLQVHSERQIYFSYDSFTIIIQTKHQYMTPDYRTNVMKLYAVMISVFSCFDLHVPYLNDFCGLCSSIIVHCRGTGVCQLHLQSILSLMLLWLFTVIIRFVLFHCISRNM